MVMSEKLEHNKKMVGQTVVVIGEHKSWEGIVIDVVDEETFTVRDIRKSARIENVSIFDIRQE